MRKFLIPFLLASAAAGPAIAAPRDWSDRQQTQEDRQQTRDDRQQAREERVQARDTAREERVQSRDTARDQRSLDRSSFTPSPTQQQFVDRAQANRADRAQQQADMREQVVDRSARVEPKTVRPPAHDFSGSAQERVVQVRQRVDQRQQDIRNGDLRQSAREVPNVMRNPHPLIVSNTPRQGTQPPLRTGVRTTPTVQWNTSWRNNHRYDWNNYRRHHHWLFHLGFYNDPYGWNYYPFQIGWRLWPSYYGNNYWINDPWMYRLPYAPPGYVWIRYWNDALLVDTWTGTVVDMIPGFFW